MTLVVDAPAAYEPERRYVLDVVLGDWLGLAWELRLGDRDDVRITVAGEPEDRCVRIPDALFATDPRLWLTEASLPVVSWHDGLPVLYGGSSAPGAFDLPVDVFGSAFFMLTRYEEAVVGERDRYGRFPASASVAHRAGFLGRPIVDAYVERLWDAMRQTWPGLRRRSRAFEVLMTHDVDHPLATLDHGGRDFARQLAGDLVRRREPRLALRRVRSLANRDLDPNNTFDFLMDVSERHGLRSAFYFLPYRDQRPRPSGAYLFEHPWVRRLIGHIGRRGHEVGLYTSFSAYRDAARTREEFSRLVGVAEAEGVRQREWGGRQHYLRWANPDTWRSWEAAGLGYDSTLGYSDAIGFRAGTCRSYRAFDVRARRPLRLREVPLHIMDVSLLEAGAADDAYARATEIAAECRRHRGSLGILWHNSTLLRSRGEQRWYEELVAGVA